MNSANVEICYKMPNFSEMRDCGNKRYQETCQTCPNKDDTEPQNNCGGDCEWNEELKACQLKGNK